MKIDGHNPGKGLMKSMAIMQILLQATLPVALSISASVRAAELSQSTRSVDKDNTSPYSAQMAQTATALSSGNVSAAGANMASGYAGDSVEKWLSQFGTARVQLTLMIKVTGMIAPSTSWRRFTIVKRRCCLSSLACERRTIA